MNETLIIVGSEFGRTPMVQSAGTTPSEPGPRSQRPRLHDVARRRRRDRAGMTYGATDDFGMRAVEKRVHPHDLHATVLHLLGLDHTRLTYRYSGRDFRLTDVAGQVLRELLA